ncbi:MAG: hypothetical protein QF412_10525 [Planctomycetota bacterium]|jgi:hypothetical protein|nr:hypothetical protein [Planctomycetota bacterium]
MIRINLLPEEYRRTERTSPKLFAATILGVILVGATIGRLGFVYFGELGRLEVERLSMEEIRDSHKNRVAYHDALAKQKGAYQKRSKTIQTIGQSRLLWTEVMDQFIDVVNNGGNTERHRAWFRGVTARDGNEKGGPGVQFPGWVQGNQIQKVADLHEDIEGSPFFVDVKEKAAPSGVVDIDEERNPSQALFFDLKWAFGVPKTWAKNQARRD